MRIDRVTLSLALVCAVIGHPITVAAQGHDVRAAVHYQLLHVPGTTFPAGVNGEVSSIIRPLLTLVAGAGWARTQAEAGEVSATARIIDFGGGLRLMPSRSHFRPFVQVMAGGVNLSVRGTAGSVTGSGSATWPQLEPGAGFHVDIAQNVAIATSVHVRRVFLDPAVFDAPGQTQWRALLGVSVQLSK
jgi:hypothetical protein